GCANLFVGRLVRWHGFGYTGRKSAKGAIVMIEVGAQAPDFTLRDAQGNAVSLKDYRGKKVVLYLYPRDNTPGCTREACAFREANEQFQAQNAVVLGVSRDSEASHQKFAEKYDLTFTLLSDPEHTVLEAYGAWGE